MTTTAPLPPVPLVVEHQMAIRSYLPVQDAQSARLQAVACLLAFGWTGPCGFAVLTVDQLVRNASEFGWCAGEDIRLLIGLAELGDLLIDVADHNPTFPKFEEVLTGRSGQGLRRIAEYGVTLPWHPHKHGKTVRAVLDGASS
ncbi:hypothetical protein [Streptomyces anulatus]|uniref:hypothetical protein n=1 Tax=Streptomyces anulatus TaxID=1892 RepID=UPI003867523D|nr:hypothetical protein OG238_40795 [Streptomyces anulatus]WSW80758.1 hypothetical protein OG536_00150 [Streptomyces anulatus]